MFLKGHSFFLATLAETVHFSEELISAAKIAWHMEKTQNYVYHKRVLFK